MDLYLAGKTALVTGASTFGCGRAIATALAREGVAVAITARRIDALTKLARELKAEVADVKPGDIGVLVGEPLSKAYCSLDATVALEVITCRTITKNGIIRARATCCYFRRR